jgi:hypothetical protein
MCWAFLTPSVTKIEDNDILTKDRLLERLEIKPSDGKKIDDVSIHNFNKKSEFEKELDRLSLKEGAFKVITE